MFDIRTLIMVGAFIMAVSTAAFFSLYRFHSKDKSPLAWGFSSAVVTLGCILLACRGSISPFLSIIVANICFALGYGFIWIGMRLFLERTARLIPSVIGTLALTPVLAFFTYVQPSTAVRSMAIRLTLAVFTFLIWRELGLGGDNRYGRPQRVVAGLYAAETALNTVFALAALYTTYSQNFLESGPSSAIFLLLCNIYMLIHVLGVVVLYGEKYRRELSDARDAAEAAGLAKGRFLAHMSHELRTPLNGLIGMIELARTANGDVERRKYLDIAGSSAQSLLAIINDILDLSRLESGKLAITPSTFSLEPTLAEILAPFEHMATSRGIDFTISVAPSDIRIEADAVRLRQITLNLAGNALKFTKQGRIEVAARLKTEDSGAERLVLTVADTGLGIPADKLDSIFENFSQTNEGEKQGGTGLGLAISRQLARLMGGDIQVSSVYGQGSLFTLDVPCRVVEAEPARREVSPRAGGVDLADIPRMLVLLVDDFEPNRMVISALLRGAGHDVIEVDSGGAAVDAVRDNSFDLVLMDIGMPGVDGVEAMRLIRTEQGQITPIVALTAYALPGDREHFLGAGMDEYLAKPVSVSELGRVLAMFAPKGGRPA